MKCRTALKRSMDGPLRKKWHDIVWKKEYSRMKINRRSPHAMKELYVQHLEKMDKCEALAARSVEELVFLYKLFPRFSGTIYYCNDSSNHEMENLVACYKARGWKLKRVRAWQLQIYMNFMYVIGCIIFNSLNFYILLD